MEDMIVAVPDLPQIEVRQWAGDTDVYMSSRGSDGGVTVFMDAEQTIALIDTLKVALERILCQQSL